MPTTHTKLATWNINRQSSYDVPTKVCLHTDIDLLHITEQPTFMDISDTPTAATLIHIADNTGYYLYLNAHSHIYIRQTTLLPRLVSQQSSHGGRLHSFIFHGADDDHSAVLVLYAFQRGHKHHTTTTHTLSINQTPSTNDHSPRHLKQTIFTLITELHNKYNLLKLIVFGNFQHTLADTTLHRMDLYLPSPPLDIFGPYLRVPLPSPGYLHAASYKYISHVDQPLRRRTGWPRPHPYSGGAHCADMH